ncbi:hypothetical protein MLL17_12125 [Escherichia coli]|uniref:hypothetical protein n=1 Tax=Escherichia coli TaxID=562 RepID=UPI000CFB9363|nr:hypothetical protein [Escherichia coli]EFC7717270.1 hypothetical protein [Escherichia coli]EGO5944755.1 hypothetical protein [Escherichia coli]EKB0259143.1 hypothetical protein [Escherichia coli]MCN7632890.1 hypothetical protein [Escherichia coli]HAX3284784.1 hypothetical protein [Escherichia coli]
MTEWLNAHFGADAATYLSLLVGVLALFGIGGGVTYRIRQQNNIKQKAKKTEGDVNQAGRDINQTTNVYHTSNESTEDPVKKKQDEHDLKIIDQILELLPYEDTTQRVEQSYLSGIRQDVCLNIEKAEKFSGEKYRLFNTEVNGAKDAFLDAMTAYVDSTLPFMSVDYPNRKPVMLSLPHDWKSKSVESEANFRFHQQNVRETSGGMIARYEDFVRTFKAHGFISDKL